MNYETAADVETRKAIAAVLMAGAGSGLPVATLIEIVVQYTLPFRGGVTTVVTQTEIDCPNATCCYYDPVRCVNTVVVGDRRRFRFTQIIRTDGRVITLNGRESPSAPVNSDFEEPRAVCTDPSRPNRLYFGTRFSVVSFDFDRTPDAGVGVGTTSLLAGSNWLGCEDGVGSKAQFNLMAGLVCTSDGRMLYAGDSGNCLVRRIDINSRAVTTLAGDGRPNTRDGIGTNACFRFPHVPVFDATTRYPTDSILYLTCSWTIRRIDLRSAEVSTLLHEPTEGDRSGAIRPRGIVTLPSGVLLFVCPGRHSLYSLDTVTRELELVAGCGLSGKGGYVNGAAYGGSKFAAPTGLCVDESERCAIIGETDNRLLRKVTLAPSLFQPLTSHPK